MSFKLLKPHPRLLSNLEPRKIEVRRVDEIKTLVKKQYNFELAKSLGDLPELPKKYQIERLDKVISESTTDNLKLVDNLNLCNREKAKILQISEENKIPNFPRLHLLHTFRRKQEYYPFIPIVSIFNFLPRLISCLGYMLPWRDRNWKIIKNKLDEEMLVFGIPKYDFQDEVKFYSSKSLHHYKMPAVGKYEKVMQQSFWLVLHGWLYHDAMVQFSLRSGVEDEPRFFKRLANHLTHPNLSFALFSMESMKMEVFRCLWEEIHHWIYIHDVPSFSVIFNF